MCPNLMKTINQRSKKFNEPQQRQNKENHSQAYHDVIAEKHS